MKLLALSILTLILTSCTNYTTMEHCSHVIGDGRVCSVVAKFTDKEDCFRYKVIYQSAIDYDELGRTGRTVARYYTTTTQGDLACK